MPSPRWVLLVRWCERALVGFGVACLAFYAVACAQGSMFQAREKASLEREIAAVIHAEEHDTSDWSPARLEHYHKSAAAPVEAIGRLDVPGAGVSVMVLPGTDELSLNRAVGHIEGTARPGEPGNVGIAGHRDGFFRGLQNVVPGDTVSLTTIEGVSRYEVTSLEIVEPTSVEVLEPTDHDALTLVTCYPFYYVGDAPKRFIVHARKVAFETHASARSAVP